MIRLDRYDDVLRLRMNSAGSRAIGLDVSAYLVRGVLVDCGFPRAAVALARTLEGQRVEGAMLTHWHEDHAGNAELLARRGIPTWMSLETERILRAAPPIRLYRRAVWGAPSPLRTAQAHFAHPALEAIPTPGHSPDHHVIWDAERETLFTGDLWLGVRARVLHENERPREILESLRRVLALRPKRMFDAHRGVVDKPEAALAGKIEWLEETIGAVERRISEGWNDARIVREVLGGEELAALVSRGEYARANLVRAIRREATQHRASESARMQGDS